MEPTLIAVTLLSLSMALAMGGVAWRLLRDERRRSDARVAALTELASREAPAGPAPGPPARRSDPPAAARPQPVPARRVVTRPAPPAPFDLPLRVPARPRPAAETFAGPVGSLFDAPAPVSRGGGRLLALVLVATVMAIGLWVAWRAGTGPDAAASAGSAPIELVSLAHDRQGDLLRITGLVQNPRAGAERRDVVAVAFLFDGAGTLVASGRAPIDFTRLAPGDESPFVILVADAERAARYRLGFRTRDGRVLAHRDRRADPAAVGGSGAAATGIAARAARPGS